MFKHIGASIVTGLAVALSGAPVHHMGRTRYPKGWKHVGQAGYRPHQGKREIARRLRQTERDEANQLLRGELVRVSRRGRILP